MPGANPNGANDTTSDPREQQAWDFYVESVLEGRESAYKAAMDAGYEESSAKNITLRGWFKERKDELRRRGMPSKAERNLERMLDTEWEFVQGKTKVVNTEIMRVVADISKTVAKTLGKKYGWTERNELTGADGKDFTVTIVQYGDKASP